MLGKIIFVLLLIVLIVLVGTFPLHILAVVFDYIGKGLDMLANVLNFFGWNGMLV